MAPSIRVLLTLHQVMRKCGGVAGRILDDVIPVFVHAFNPDNDPESRLRCVLCAVISAVSH